MTNIQMAEIKLTHQEIEAANRVLSSGALRQGSECEAFEREFAEKVGARHAVASASGTAALHLAYLSFLKPGDEVLVPSFTFIATGSMVAITGAKPIFCDVDPETFLLDLEDARNKVTERTRGIAPVHLFGNACGIEEVRTFAQRYGLTVVWDAAQAHGATYKDIDIGAFEDFVCYSFYPSKNMFVGEGGMTCTDSEEMARAMKDLRSHGQTGKYYHTRLGLNYRMTDVEATIGREQLKRLDKMLAARRKNAAILNATISRINGLRPQRITGNSEHAWHQYCVLVEGEQYGKNRDQLAEELKKRGIATGVHYPRGLHQQPIFQDLYGEDTVPVTERLSTQIIALPVHHGLSEDQVHAVVDALRDIAEG